MVALRSQSSVTCGIPRLSHEAFDVPVKNAPGVEAAGTQSQEILLVNTKFVNT